LHLVGILFPHINEDALSKSHQIYKDFVNSQEPVSITKNKLLNSMHDNT